MGKVGSIVWRSEIMEENTINVDRTSIPYASMETRQWFCQELETAVRKHSQYLYEVENMARRSLPKWYLLTKRAIDIFACIVGLILLSPLFLVVAVLIKLDSRGPIFLAQERVGKNRKQFKMYKFRTMVDDAEKKTGPVWAIDNDPRLTFMGRLMRKRKIDELPQLLNVIKGDMSLVGPRPERPFFVDYFIEHVPGYYRRLEVTPGITGPAQLRNGSDYRPIDVIRKLRFDINYIKKMRLSIDIMLLVLTVMAVLKGKVGRSKGRLIGT